MKQFNLEDFKKNPDRKVITRDGREVEILKTNCKSKIPMIVLYDDNDVQWVAANGTIKDIQDTCNDLFFADEEEELTEFEKEVSTLLTDIVYDYESEQDLCDNEYVRNVANKLLELAKEELKTQLKFSSDMHGWEYGVGYEQGVLNG